MRPVGITKAADVLLHSKSNAAADIVMLLQHLECLVRLILAIVRIAFSGAIVAGWFLVVPGGLVTQSERCWGI